MVNAGRRRIAATLAGHIPAGRTVELAGLDTVNVELDLAPVLAPRSTVAEPAPRVAAPPLVVAEPAAEGRRAPFTPWLWTVPAGLAAASLGFTVAAISSSSHLQDVRYDPDVSLGEQKDISSRTKAFGITAGVLGGAAVVSAGVLGGLWLFGPERNPRAAARLWVAPDGIVVAGQF